MVDQVARAAARDSSDRWARVGTAALVTSGGAPLDAAAAVALATNAVREALAPAVGPGVAVAPATAGDAATAAGLAGARSIGVT